MDCRDEKRVGERHVVNDDGAVSPSLVLGFGCGCTSNNRTPPRLWHYFPEPQKAPKAKTKNTREKARPGAEVWAWAGRHNTTTRTAELKAGAPSSDWAGLCL